MRLGAVLIATIAAAPAFACDQHEADESEARRTEAVGAIAFQPTAPERPEDGDLWIDADNGAQYRFSKDGWTLRATPAFAGRIARR